MKRGSLLVRACVSHALLLAAFGCSEEVSLDFGDASTSTSASDVGTSSGLDASPLGPFDAAGPAPSDASAAHPVDAASPDLPDAGPDTADAGSGPDASASNCTAPAEWNFFVISKEAIVREAGSSEGLGGNLGGLSGADAKCQRAAELAHGSCGKTWVAFLSVTNDGTGQPLNAIDRIGEGPWHDVNGYLLAESKPGLLGARPDGDDQTVVWSSGYQQWVFTNCLTTELGNCNHSYGDSHDTLTGSKANGTLYSTDPTYTCNDWTSTTNNRSCDGTHGVCWPAIGHTWPAHSGQGWLYSHLAGGCQANINLADNFENGVGGHGGYGAFYCFAVP